MHVVCMGGGGGEGGYGGFTLTFSLVFAPVGEN